MWIRREVTVLGAVLVVAGAGCASQSSQVTQQPSVQAPAGGGSVTAPVQAAQTMPDTIAQQNDRWVAQITAQIAGRENLPAEQVFKDIQLLNGQPATRVLAIMNAGYARALGVSCAHCHDPAAWESDARPQKKEARGMIRMVNMINEGNKTIPEFAGDPPVVNCTVCHRGARRPIRNLPAPGGGQRGGAPGGQGAAPPVRTTD